MVRHVVQEWHGVGRLDIKVAVPLNRLACADAIPTVRLRAIPNIPFENFPVTQ